MSTPIGTEASRSNRAFLPSLQTDDLLDFKHLNGPAMNKHMIANEHKNKWTNLNTGNLYKLDSSQSYKSCNIYGMDRLYDM